MRRYGCWAGNPKGTPEDKTRCVAQVYNGSRMARHQCCFKRGRGPDGLYCTRHAAKTARGLVVFVPKDEPEKENAMTT